MKILPVLVSAAVLAVGLFGGTLAYQTASGSSGTSAEVSQSTAAAPITPTANRTVHQRPTVRWAPCEKPAVRHGKVCVTEEVRTVVVPAPAASAPTPAPAPAAPVAHSVGSSDDHGERAEPEDRDEHGDDGEHGDHSESDDDDGGGHGESEDD